MDILKINTESGGDNIFSGFTKTNIAIGNLITGGTLNGTTLTLNKFDGTQISVNGFISSTASGITSVNGLTTQVQFFQSGQTGTDFNISSVGSTHTFNLPFASNINTGKLSSSDWNSFNNKIDNNTFTNFSSNTNTLLTTKLNINDFTVYSSNTLNNFNSKVNTNDFNSYSSFTLTNINSKLNKTDFDNYSSNTLTQLNNKLNTTTFSPFSSTTNSRLNRIENQYISLTGTSNTTISGDLQFNNQKGINSFQSTNEASIKFGNQTNETLQIYSKNLNDNSSVGLTLLGDDFLTGMNIYGNGIQPVNINTESGSININSTNGTIGISSNNITIGNTNQKIGFFGSTPILRQTGATATAGGTYTSNEQVMLQKCYNVLRAYNLMN